MLCLFEQDLSSILGYIVKYIKKRESSNHSLCELSIYNFDDKDSLFFEAIVRNFFDKCKVVKEQKGSGYKSIHLLVHVSHGSNLKHEIQIRTLLQDVWGELEHAVAYKQGNIHPHIKKSFQLLSKDLQSNDDLITHLRSIGDKEKCANEFSLKESGPMFVLDYDEGLEPQCLHKGRVGKLVDKYKKRCKNKGVGWIKDARELYDQIKSIINGSDCEYWINMENAFLLFSEKKHDDAMKLYNKIVESGHDDKYVPHFRLGELNFIKGNIDKCLIEFDKSEEILLSSKYTELNEYYLMRRLAYIYWSYGEEYIDISLRKIEIAHKIAISIKDEESQNRTIESLTNLCWYKLEKFITEKTSLLRKGLNFKLNGKHEISFGCDLLRKVETDDSLVDCEAREKIKKETVSEAIKKVTLIYEDVRLHYEQLEKLVLKQDEAEKTANAYDTMAWFCYHVSLISDGEDGDNKKYYLNKALDYCGKSWSHKNVSLHSMNSINLIRIHTQEIMNEVQRLQNYVK